MIGWCYDIEAMKTYGYNYPLLAATCIRPKQSNIWSAAHELEGYPCFVCATERLSPAAAYYY